MHWAEYLEKLHNRVYSYTSVCLYNIQNIFTTKTEKDAKDIYNMSRLEKMTIIFTAKS